MFLHSSALLNLHSPAGGKVQGKSKVCKIQVKQVHDEITRENSGKNVQEWKFRLSSSGKKVQAKKLGEKLQLYCTGAPYLTSINIWMRKKKDVRKNDVITRSWQKWQWQWWSWWQDDGKMMTTNTIMMAAILLTSSPTGADVFTMTTASVMSIIIITITIMLIATIIIHLSTNRSWCVDNDNSEGWDEC